MIESSTNAHFPYANISLATVRGVDIFPPPVTWMPPNCILEVDDVLREWTWREPFDFIHLRIMLGAFTEKEWDIVYQKCYEYVTFLIKISLFLEDSHVGIQKSQAWWLD